MKAPVPQAEPAPGEHTAAPYADAKDAERPSTPQPTDFHPVRGACIPPRNKIDRSNRIRRPVLKLRPDAGVHKHHQALRPIGQAFSFPLRALLDFEATPRTSCYIVAKLPATSAFPVPGLSAALAASPVWLAQGDAHRQ
mmetsp:Transcript_13236/g.30718  ORF Transcript_13236/g.30718 Transcript_13236/m.30718 type:complete len:139 (-) Transcript_13236:187-603(-)